MPTSHGSALEETKAARRKMEDGLGVIPQSFSRQQDKEALAATTQIKITMANETPRQGARGSMDHDPLR
jgi:hypothetical protein